MVAASVIGLYWVLGAGVLFALLSLTRFSVNLGVFDRPVFAALIWGAVTGHWESAFGAGLFFELLWLDHFPAGTHIPPNALFATLFSLCLMELFGLRQALDCAPVLLLAIPFAHLGARVEKMERERQDAGYNNLLRWARKSGSVEYGHLVVRYVTASLLRHVTVNSVVFVLSTLAMAVVLSFFNLQDLGRFVDMRFSWGHAWFAAGMGAMLSLRLRKPQITFGVSVLVLAIIGFVI